MYSPAVWAPSNHLGRSSSTQSEPPAKKAKAAPFNSHFLSFGHQGADASKTQKIKEEIAAKPEFATIQSQLYKNAQP
jgi:hypothetical protein